MYGNIVDLKGPTCKREGIFVICTNKNKWINEIDVFVVFVFCLVDEHFSIITEKEIGKKTNRGIRFPEYRIFSIKRYFLDVPTSFQSKR